MNTFDDYLQDLAALTANKPRTDHEAIDWLEAIAHDAQQARQKIVNELYPAGGTD